jgi:hypothetical protein
VEGASSAAGAELIRPNAVEMELARCVPADPGSLRLSLKLKELPSACAPLAWFVEFAEGGAIKSKTHRNQGPALPNSGNAGPLAAFVLWAEVISSLWAAWEAGG